MTSSARCIIFVMDSCCSPVRLVLVGRVRQVDSFSLPVAVEALLLVS